MCKQLLTMNVDKFGLNVFKKQKCYHNDLSEPPIGITDNGCLDARNKIIKHIGKPIDPQDCASKLYVDNAIQNLSSKLKSISQTLAQTEIEISSLKQSIESISQRSRKK